MMGIVEKTVKDNARIKAIELALADSIDVKQKTIQRHKDLILLVAQVMVVALSEGKKIIWMGNGGSAADAQHLAGELVGRFKFERPPLASLALNSNSSILTAVGNDYGFEQVFVRQVLALAREGDVIVGISTSGNSKNIIAALEAARTLNCVTVGLTGAGGGRMAKIVDYLLDVDSNDTPRIQETHIIMGHILCELVEAGIYEPAK